ncbi:MAG: hypothetical protein GEU77_13890 [Deltaproteobacteria bacterium]|nr:hypothetical protein [Deltaproteobacteria bacterium]
MEAALIAFQNIATLERMMFLFGGVLMGLALGAMPDARSGWVRSSPALYFRHGPVRGVRGHDLPSTFCFYLSQPRERLWISSTYAIGILGLIVGVFHVILSVPWPEGVFPQAER